MSILLVLVLLAALWLSGCATLPNAYALIHSRRLYRKPPEFVDFQEPLTRSQGEAILKNLEARVGKTDVLTRHLAFEQAISGSPLVLGNKVTLLENGPATYAAMLKAIRAARNNINLEMYIVSDDVIGDEFADALIAKEKQGVQVNLIYDSFGSMNTPASYFDRLRANGVKVLQFNPIGSLAARLHWSLGHRDHRKLLVVDGKIAFLGGINISAVYMTSGIARSERNALDFWRDTDVEIQGPVVAQCQRLFISVWKSQQGPPLAARNYFPLLKQKGDDIVRVLGSVPEQFSLIYVTLISAINNAENNIYITDAYFAPDQQMLQALDQAAERGVDVRLLLPGHHILPLIGAAGRYDFEQLLGAGVRIYQWRGEMLHAKTATIDGVWSTVGSSNLDWWSIAHNNEINAVILSPGFARRMERMFANDLKNANQINWHRWRHRSLLERLDEGFAHSFQTLL